MGQKGGNRGRNKKPSSEQIIGKLREDDVWQSIGMLMEEILQQPCVSDGNYYRSQQEEIFRHMMTTFDLKHAEEKCCNRDLILWTLNPPFYHALPRPPI